MASPSDASVEALASILAEENTATYREVLAGLAQRFGVAPPAEITDARVLADIRDRARVSAQAIATTRADEAAKLINAYGDDRGMAQAEFDDFAARQADLVAAYESAVTAAAAMQDFVANNDQLTGEEWVEPDDSSGDECQEAIDMGRQPLGTIDPPPYHQNCPHYLASEFDMADDPGALWFGEE